jgi:isopentenyl-diphosphate delta-isomerase
MMDSKIYVVLVDESDKEIGIAEKMEAHRKSLLHRAISVFIVNSKGQWLLQRRSMSKYHSQGLWTNACCTHPFPGESNVDAAKRRLKEEMGLSSDLRKLFHFTYIEKLDNELTEHELDHVFVGVTDDLPKINTDEVMDYKYIDFKDLNEDIKRNPQNYTVWFRMIFERVQQHLLP